MTQQITPHTVGTAIPRTDGRAKVTGTAPYAFEHRTEHALYLHPLQASIARGRIVSIDTTEASRLDGVVAVLTPATAEALHGDDQELKILQSDAVSFRGQFIGAAVAETPEIARQAADLLKVEYEQQTHDVVLTADRDDLYATDPDFDTQSSYGDLADAMARAEHTLDATYTTPMEHNNPMEPHTTVALWDGQQLTLYDSTQGVHDVRVTIAPVFNLDESQVRVIAPYVGGGFGSKGLPHANVVLAALAARAIPDRPVKFALTRQQMFSVAGYRTPTIQRIRLGADAHGKLTALGHDAVEQTARIKEFAEQSAAASRNMYAATTRQTGHRLAALDVPVPSWMRAPGECPGIFALEVAMDEMAAECGMDPIDFRVHNEPDVDPETGKPFSSRHLVDCMRLGARKFGWDQRAARPGQQQVGEWLTGIGMAASIYPVIRNPGSTARIRAEADGTYRVSIGAMDIGTGTWTALTQIAADALEVPPDSVDLHIGDTALPMASVAGGSSGITSWGSAICEAARQIRKDSDSVPEPGTEVEAVTPENPDTQRFAMHAYGAHFAEVHVHADTGEIRVPRMLGVYAAGRIINARTARSQFIGGMNMGLSMALHEVSVLDPQFGHVVNHDFAEYHIATHADARSIDAIWLDEDDPYVNPMGSKGIGEIGNVGSAAAIANATFHATAIRIRDLPITPDKLVLGGE